MNYESFRMAFAATLRDSGLASPVAGTTETLDLHTLDRTYQIAVEPIGGQDAEPFFVAATLAWTWSALHTARARTCEEDVLTDMLGGDRESARTDKPWIRVDIKLRASLPWGKPLPMPLPTAWREWVRETMTRFERVEPLTPDESVRTDRSGRIAVLAWQGEPLLHATCSATGELKLDGVEIAAWQAIEVPRVYDDPGQASDAGPEQQLADLLARVRAALSAWMQALDHLAPLTSRSSS
jgi:hypothetical protein